MVTKRFLRRGKRLVSEAYVATNNDRNEFGRAAIERTHPFTSSSFDLLQATLRRNSNIQYMDRAVRLDMQGLCGEADAANERGERPAQSSRILYIYAYGYPYIWSRAQTHPPPS